MKSGLKKGDRVHLLTRFPNGINSDDVIYLEPFTLGPGYVISGHPLFSTGVTVRLGTIRRVFTWDFIIELWPLPEKKEKSK